MNRKSIRFPLIGAAVLVLGACTIAREIDDGGTDARMTIDLDAIIPPDTGATHCDPGMVNCAGLCTRVSIDPMNCGSCGNVCPMGTGCAVGACSCHAPMLACDGLCIDPQTDHDHCGACGHACDATQVCSLGECIVMCTAADHQVCVATDPSGTRTQICADLMNDSNNCGTCNTHCAGGATCYMGSCQCPAGELACSGTCTDVSSDPLNCGSCLSSCGGADGTCSLGVCTACGGGGTLCGSPGRCYDTMTSTLHCGMCGNACPGGATCYAGTCTCPGGATACGLSCVDLTADPRNCGSCGHVCQAMSTCTASACVCDTGLSDCSGVCVDEQTDVHNCGGCAIDCGVGGACSAGTCTCAAGFDMCDGVSCTNTQNDAMNCGVCGMACAPGEVCLMGGCTSAPPTHYRWRTTTVAEAPWIDACAAAGHLTVLTSYDDGDILEPLPFAFRYWATNLPAGAMINLSSNGFISMDGVLNSSYYGTLPSTSTPNATIAAHWGDLETRATGICVATVGAAPNRQWVVEWNDAQYLADDTSDLTFEVVLSESAATIDIIFNTTTNAISRYTGIEDQTGSMSLGGCAAGAYMCVPTPTTRVRFEPIP